MVVLVMVLGIGHKTGFNKEVREGLQDDPRPLSPIVNYMHPGSLNNTDTLMDKEMMLSKEPDYIYYDTINTNFTDTIHQ